MLACALLSVASPAQEPTFRTSAPVVLVPVTVTDRKGKFVETLKSEDFVLLSDGKEKAFHMDSAESVSAPLAIVIAVQTNDISATANLKVRQVGSLIQPLITGDRGRAAVVGYGDTSVLLADFTKDPNVLVDAFLRTAASQGGNAARQIDAVAYAAQMLGARPQGERKILILLGESKDRGSATKMGDALKIVQKAAITVFAATWSPYETAFTTKGNDTPNATSDTDLLAGIGEMARLAKRDSARRLVQATGGEKLGFATLKGLEHDLTRLGEELHGQYLLSFPAQDAAPGYHSLEVQVKNRSGLKVRSRDGFWVAEKPEPKPETEPRP
jgi:VWFA-related protein